MSTMVLADLQVKPENITEMKSLMAEIITDTRVFEGCQNIAVYFNTDDEGNMVLVEQWDSPEDYKKYHAWRAGSGVIDKIRTMLAKPASIRFYNISDI